MQEVGTTEQILAAPAHDYTQSLLAAARPRRAHTGHCPQGEGELLLEVREPVRPATALWTPRASLRPR